MLKLIVMGIGYDMQCHGLFSHTPKNLSEYDWNSFLLFSHTVFFLCRAVHSKPLCVIARNLLQQITEAAILLRIAVYFISRFTKFCLLVCSNFNLLFHTTVFHSQHYHNPHFVMMNSHSLLSLVSSQSMCPLSQARIASIKNEWIASVKKVWRASIKKEWIDIWWYKGEGLIDAKISAYLWLRPSVCSCKVWRARQTLFRDPFFQVCCRPSVLPNPHL